MRVQELYLLHSRHALCTGHLRTGHAEETQHTAHNCLVPRPKGPSTAGSETGVATMTVVL